MPVDPQDTQAVIVGVEAVVAEQVAGPKPLLKMRTLWALSVPLLVLTLHAFGKTLPPGMQEFLTDNLPDTLMDIAGLVGAVAAGYFRVKATSVPAATDAKQQ